MNEETPTPVPESIPDLVRKIETTATKSDDQVIELAMLVLELRRRVEAGEVGEVNWYVWAEENLKLRKTKLRTLMRIAEAPNKRKQAALERELIARRQAKFRANQPRLNDLAPECREIIKWAKMTSVEEAKAILRVIHLRSNTQNSWSIGHSAD